MDTEIQSILGKIFYAGYSYKDVWANSENDDEDDDDDIELNVAAEVEAEFVPRNVDEETPQQKRGRIQNSLIEWIHRRNEEININF